MDRTEQKLWFKHPAFGKCYMTSEYWIGAQFLFGISGPEENQFILGRHIENQDLANNAKKNCRLFVENLPKVDPTYHCTHQNTRVTVLNSSFAMGVELKWLGEPLYSIGLYQRADKASLPAIEPVYEWGRDWLTFERVTGYTNWEDGALDGPLERLPYSCTLLARPTYSKNTACWESMECFRCTDAFSFVCKAPSMHGGGCPNKFVNVTGSYPELSDHCYYVAEKTVSICGTEAMEQICVGLGGHLASIHSKNESLAVQGESVALSN